MKNKLRNLIVNGQKLFWCYQPYIRHFSEHTSRLIAFNKDDNIKIEIFFCTEDNWLGGNPLNEGLPVIKNGEREKLSFNRPKFVSELLQMLFAQYSKEEFENLIITNGNPLIHQMGYREIYEEYKNPSFRYIKEQNI